MALDSLGLGLTLDTTLLAKADKTLENMHRNSQLIMQNLNRGFSAFNRGDISDFSKPFDAIKKAMDTIKNSKVSVEFDSAGQDRFLEGLNQIMEQVERIRQIGEVGDNKIKFFDPSTVKVTTESLTELQAQAQEIEEAFKEVQKELSHAIEFGKDVSGNDAKIAKLKDDLSEIGKAAGLVTKDFSQMQEELKELVNISVDEVSKAALAKGAREEKLVNDVKAENSKISKKELENIKAQDEELRNLVTTLEEKKNAWKEANDILTKYTKQLEELSTLEAKKEAHDNLQLNRDKEKAYQELLAENRAQQKFAGATTAQQNAMIVSEEHKRLSEENKRIATLTKNYLEAVSNYEKYQSELSQLLDNIATVGGKRTSAQDEERTRLLQEIDRARSIIHELKKEAPEVIEKIEAVKRGENTQKIAAESAEKVKASLDYAKVFSDNAKSIDEEIEAISMLKRARNALASDTTADYDKEIDEANKRISKHEDHIKLLTQEQKESKTLEDSVISRYLRERKEADKLGDELRKLNRTRKERGTDYSDEEKKNIDALISRWRTLRNDISEIEANNAAHLSQLQEKYASQRAEDEIKIMLATNEREKQEYAKLLDDLYAIEKQKKSMEDAGAKKGDKAYDNILQQEQDLNNQISQLKAKHQKDLDEIDKRHAKKRNDDDVKAFIEAQNEKIKEAEKAQKKIDANKEKYGTISKADAEAAIVSAKDAQNIAQHKKAIEDLQRVKAKLDNTDKDYFVTLKKVDDALEEHHKALREAGEESSNLMQTHRGLLNIGGQLARRLALAFSVSQLTQYFRKLVEVRGQFEKTEVALASIIRDNQKAQKLMNQTIALAIQSPFTLQQLTGYTKQLAAYQVSYEELHSTTKMLADVSAGLGVEMDRLILAFGQVKAANYLRATEVRQFTEAGFNILGELADYYNELEGTMLSVGDVQEMVTKRMVDFADVEAVFHRVTEAGGMFYEMQSKQAETLAGQWTNLKDRIDVMLNEIGTSNEGMLKGLVSLLASVIDNWEALGQVIKTVVTAFVLYKLNLLAVNKAQIQNALATQAQRKAYIALIKRQIQMVGLNKVLGKSFKNLWGTMGKGVGVMKNFLTANKWVLILTAVAASITAVVRQYRRMQEALGEQDKAFNENASSLQKLAKAYEKITNEGGEFEKKLAKLKELSSMLEDRNLRLSVKIEDVDESNIDEIFKEDSERLQKAHELGKSLGRAIARGANEAQGNIFGWSTFGENLAEDAEDYGKSMAKLTSWGMKAQMESIENMARANYDKMGKYAKEYFAIIEEGRKKDPKTGDYTESEYKWTKRRAEALVMISILEKDIVGKNKELQRALRAVTHDTIELHHESKGIFDNLADEAGGLANLRRKAKENPIEMSAQITTEVDKLDYDPATKEFLINDLHARLWITPNYVEDPNIVVEDDLKKFQQDLMDARTRLAEGGESYENFFISTDDIKKMEGFSDGLEGIQKLYDENKKTIEQLDGTQDSYSKEEKARLDALQKELRAVAKLWGYDLDKGKNGKNDELLKRLKDQINLVKEMNKEYEKLNKTYSKTDSLEKVRNAYAETAKQLGFNLSEMDFTDEGTIKSLEDLLGKPEYAANEYALELKKALDNLKVEIGIETKQGEDERLKNDIQKLFDQYDLTLELKKLNIPSDLAKSLFDVDYLDLDGLKKAVQDQEAKFIGTDMEKEYEDFLKKINDLSRKQREDEAKEFVNFLKKNLNEIQLIQDKGAYNIALADRLFGQGKITAEQYMSSIRQIVEDTNKEVAKVNLDKFKDSATYIKAMGNLAAYSRDELEGMISALQGQVGANAGNMGADEIRAYYEALERLVDQYDKLESPFQKGEINDLIEYLNLQKELNKEKEKEAALEQKKLEINNRLNLLQAQLKSQQERGDVLGAASTQRQIKSAVSELKEVDGELVSVTSNISVISEKVANLGDGMVKGLVVAQKVVNEIANIANASTKMFDDIKSAADALGADTESGGWAKAGYAMEMVGGVSSELTSGLSNLASGNFAGALANVVGMVTKLISGFAKIHDQNYQDIIEAEAEAVERLGKAYEKLETATESAYSIQQLQQYNEELERNVELQIASYKAMIAAEQAKKNTDEEQIEAWNEELEALTQQWEDLKQSLVEGVGGVSDYRSQTREFVDSWVSAFKKTGDGLSGLKDNFREFFDNIIAEQAAMRVTEKYLEPFYASLNEALNDYELTAKESKDLRELVETIAPDLSSALEKIWSQLGGSLGEADGAGLSSLQKGISGMSEEQAEILTAYWNSVRGYTASIDSKMDLILANMGVGTENNPMLEQLISQTGWLSKIHGILEDVASASPRAFKTALM